MNEKLTNILERQLEILSERSEARGSAASSLAALTHSMCEIATLITQTENANTMVEKVTEYFADLEG